MDQDPIRTVRPKGSSVKDVRMERGGVWPNADKSGQGGGESIFTVLLRTSFMDDP